MLYYNVANLVTLTDKYDNTKCLVVMLEPLLGYYGTKSPPEMGSSIGCSQSMSQSCAAVSASLEVSCRSAQMSLEVQHLSILQVKSCSILNTPP